MHTRNFILACIAVTAAADMSPQQLLIQTNNMAALKAASSVHAQLKHHGLSQISADAEILIPAEEGDTEVVLEKKPRGFNPNTQSPVLAQTFDTARGHTCFSVSDRNKALLVDYDTISKGDWKYTDLDFFPNNDALYWKDMGEGEETAKQAEKTTWRRVSDVYPKKKLFGKGISSDDIAQGGLGNCWFMSAAAAVAEIPGRLDKVFATEENALNKNGIYAFNFYTLGVPHAVIIDDYLPLKDNGNGTYGTLFAKLSTDDKEALWAPLLEKAFAKYHGNYEKIVGGQTERAVRTLTGAPGVTTQHSALNSDQLWDLLKKHDESNDIMTAGTAGGGNHDVKTVIGLAESHAYTVLGCAILSNGQKLVKMRNPWSSETFKGDWSRNSDKWTPELKAEVGEDGADDGVFFMSLVDFHSNFSSTSINLDTTGMHNAYILKLNDQSPSNGTWGNHCGDGCVQHTYTITSTVDQTIYVEAHTWDSRQQTAACKQGRTKYSIFMNKQTRADSKFADQFSSELVLKAGESADVAVEWDFTSPGVLKDWSVVAWGTSGPLTITTPSFDTSDQLPVLGGAGGFAHTHEVPEVYKEPTKAELAAAREQVQNEFNKIADDWKSVGTGCGWKFSQFHNQGADGLFRKYFLANSTCGDIKLKVTVYMSIEDWDNIEVLYENVDANGKVQASTVWEDCKQSMTDPTQKSCTLLLGGLTDHKTKHGIEQQYNPVAGIMMKPNTTGITSYSSTYEWV